MKIKRLVLKNFRGFENIEIDFPDSNVCVFIGINGAGKSSILDAIFFHLDSLIGDIFRFRKNNSFYSQESYTDIFGVITPLYTDINSKKNYFNIDIDFENTNTIYQSRVSFQSHMSHNQNIGLLNYYTYTKKQPLFLKYNVDRFTDDDSENLKVDKNDTDLWIYRILRNTRGYKEFTLWFKDLEDLENAEIAQRKDFNYSNPLLKITRDAVKHFLTNFHGEKYENLRIYRDKTLVEWEAWTNNDAVLMIDKGSQSLLLFQLSDGEKMLLMMVCDIARKLILLNPKSENPLAEEGIVLIDEIELHLHPQWQRQVIPALTSTFPNIQFIVATHSPQILGSLDKSEIRILKDGEVYIPSVETLGNDTNSILGSLMDTPIRDAEVNSELDRIFSLINDKKFEDAENIGKDLIRRNKISPNDTVFKRIESLKKRFDAIGK